MDWTEQEAHWDRLVDLAWERCLQEHVDDERQTKLEAKRRLRAGEPVYGDAGWFWTPMRLRRERREERADELNYMVFELQGYGL